MKKNAKNRLEDSSIRMTGAHSVIPEDPAAGSSMGSSPAAPRLSGAGEVRDKVVEKVYEAVLD